MPTVRLALPEALSHRSSIPIVPFVLPATVPSRACSRCITIRICSAQSVAILEIEQETTLDEGGTAFERRPKGIC